MSSHVTFDLDAFRSLANFEHRIQEFGQIASAKDAIATFDYFYQNLKHLRELTADELVGEIALYSRSSPGNQIESGPLNEAAIVLLSAYLEGFIEELHAEAAYHFLQEKAKPTGVLKALLEYAQDRFSNPKAYRINDLFTTLQIMRVVSKLAPDVKAKEIDKFIEIRNRIAHGKRVTVTNREIQEFGTLALKVAQGLTREVAKELNELRG